MENPILIDLLRSLPPSSAKQKALAGVLPDMTHHEAHAAFCAALVRNLVDPNGDVEDNRKRVIHALETHAADISYQVKTLKRELKAA